MKFFETNMSPYKADEVVELFFKKKKSDGLTLKGKYTVIKLDDNKDGARDFPRIILEKLGRSDGW